VDANGFWQSAFGESFDQAYGRTCNTIASREPL
jgi:hypothetical protein